MPAQTALKAARALRGRPDPRIAPPLPARSRQLAFGETSAELGYPLMPWQRTAGRYLTALGHGDRWLYREVAIVVGRQNGKTTLLVPHILSRLRMGRRIMHTAQNRELPREVFGLVADVLMDEKPSPLRSRPRFANGQEEIRMRNGGRYRIVAASRGGARGPSNDDVIVDELREMDDFTFISAAKPTLAASRNPQFLYLSNAGDDTSVVLNALRSRAGDDPSLAYLEWSAAPGRGADDVAGWQESNPALGHLPALYETLQMEYQSNRLAGTLAIFETEHLCRWVTSMQPRLLTSSIFQRSRVEVLERPVRPALAFSMDPGGRRASAAIAWRQTDGTIGLRIEAEAYGEPIDTDTLGPELAAFATKAGALRQAFDPGTDADLARHLKRAKPLIGRDFAAACENFVRRATEGSLRWDNAGSVADDLDWTSRKAHESGSYTAVRSSEERPITAVLAAIRAVWLASAPQPTAPHIW